MAMNKKEKEYVTQLENDIATALAFTFTPKVLPDVPPPKEYTGFTTGYSYNAYSLSVKKACSSATGHGIGVWDRTNSQHPISLFSTKEKAYRAMRNDLEITYAKQLAKIDLKIKELSE